jgi:hypothetical protein
MAWVSDKRQVGRIAATARPNHLATKAPQVPKYLPLVQGRSPARSAVTLLDTRARLAARGCRPVTPEGRSCLVELNVPENPAQPKMPPHWPRAQAARATARFEAAFLRMRALKGRRA